ncbi:MAG: peptide-methionine (S)-S-oxide reductase MsrA [Candidatus Micrarchaeota archaeon]|nr:peptide-methionine (S)-S-oxide reductase MsrA [Candidatus Micrarchaeota archaeon]
MPGETIVFGGGCFWCTEAVFRLFKGVLETMPGYAGGTTPNPTYDQVCDGYTGHAEVLKVDYDPRIINLDKLLDIFFTMHDPTTLNRQGADVGTQYRSIILYTEERQKESAELFIKRIQPHYGSPIVTEVKKLDAFYPAEDHHRRYFEKNPRQGYCSVVIGPKIQKVKKKYGLP